MIRSSPNEYRPLRRLRRLLATALLTVAALPAFAEMACPDRQFSTEELAAVVASARDTRSDIPPRYGEYSVRVERVRCLYLYFEYAVPAAVGHYMVFTIDPYGELMSFDVSQSRAGK